MEFWIGGIIVLVITGFIIYSLKDEEHNSWDD